MALIIEDGTIVENANSFATVAECRAYADPRGLTLPVEDGDVEILLIKATDYLNSLESKYQGDRYNQDQELSFPRESIYLFDKYIGGTIPKILKNGQCQLAFDTIENDLLAPGTGREVLEEAVGALKVKYAESGTTAPQFNPTAAIAILDPLFKPSSDVGINLLSYR